MKDRAWDIAWEITEGLQGHCAMESVTNYLVEAINEKYGLDFEDTTAMLEWSVRNGGECFECEHCGWYVEYLDFVEGTESTDGEAHEGCSECLSEFIKD